MKGRRAALCVLVALMCMASAFADTSSATGAFDLGSAMNVGGANTRNPFSLPLNFFETLILSTFTGALISSKFVIDLVRAYMSNSQSESTKKAIARLVITLFVMIFACSLIMYVTGISGTSETMLSNGYDAGYLTRTA